MERPMFDTIIEEENTSRFPELIAYPEITDEDTLRELIGEPIILSHYNEETIDDLIERLTDIGVRCWNNLNTDGSKLQQILISYKQFDDSDETYVIQFNRFLISLGYIKPVLPYLKDIDIMDFVLEGFHTEKGSYDFQNKIRGVLNANCVSYYDSQEIIADVAMSLKNIMYTFSQADAEIITAENLFLDHYVASEVIRDINNTEYPPNMQPSEIIEENAKKYKILEKEMFRLHNVFFENQYFCNILKPKQVEESMINFSLSPDGRRLITVTQNGNGFHAGYNSIPTLYVAAMSARVPDLINSDHMGEAGYFNRNLMILTYGTISPTVWDCGSRNRLAVRMDETNLAMYIGRYYSTDPDGKLLILHGNETQYLGQTLYFRSPTKCNLNEDVCQCCYGTIAMNIGDLPGGFIYTTEVMTSRIAHNILSAKHILKANAIKIELSPNFEKYFEMEQSMVFPRDDKVFDVYIPENFHDEIADHLIIYIKKGKNLEPVEISRYASIYIPDELLDKCKEIEVDDVTYLKISSTKIADVSEKLCDITPINIMTSQKYMDIRRLIEFELPKFDTAEEIVDKINHDTYKLMPVLAVHNEVIIGRHLRSTSNELLRPNWLNPNEPYKIFRLRSALEKIESVAIAYSFEKPYDNTHKKIFDERNKINRVGVRSFADFMYGQTKSY